MWTGDCLDVMRGMNSESVDLIYLDPPFNSKRNYAAPIGSPAAGAAFKDTWTLDELDVEWINLIEQEYPRLYQVLLAAMTDSDKSYLVYMAARLLEMPRLLKPNGSIYLHCDPTMSHYLKLLMDGIWEPQSFRNEIVWCYRGGGVPRRDFARRHDVILRYSPGTPVFNVDDVRIPYSEDSMERLEHRARSFRSSGVYDSYRPNPKGKHPEDWWTIQPIMPSSKERIGYPTQKPLALLNRIIRASSNEGDMVLDPFCGCATACVASENLGRQWAGIDISAKAGELVMQRLAAGDSAVRRDDIILRTDTPQRTDVGLLPRPNSQQNREVLYGKQAGNCAGCGTHFEMQHLEVDHIIARSKGGTDHLTNLQLLCGNCNRIKGDRGMEYLRTKLQLRV
jgi:site-specific DNA-methyltransferase (adenine-specific)